MLRTKRCCPGVLRVPSPPSRLAHLPGPSSSLARQTWQEPGRPFLVSLGSRTLIGWAGRLSLLPLCWRGWLPGEGGEGPAGLQRGLAHRQRRRFLSHTHTGGKQSPVSSPGSQRGEERELEHPWAVVLRTKRPPIPNTQQAPKVVSKARQIFPQPIHASEMPCSRKRFRGGVSDRNRIPLEAAAGSPLPSPSSPSEPPRKRDRSRRRRS